MTLLLPNGNPTNGGTYLITFNVQGSKTIKNPDGTESVDMLSKNLGVLTTMSKFTQDELNALGGQAQQGFEQDPDFRIHSKGIEDYRVTICIVFMQKLD